ncbi:bifunctional DNA primase/polymerase [Streptomyces sp. NPDC001970]
MRPCCRQRLPSRAPELCAPRILVELLDRLLRLGGRWHRSAPAPTADQPEPRHRHRRQTAPDEADHAPCGATSFAALCERAGQSSPATYTVRTPSGGLHLYFQTPPGVYLPCTAKSVAPNVDTRAWGGNIVAAGSATTAGAYEMVDDAPVVALPGWLLPHLQTAPKPAVAPAPLLIPGQATRRAEVALERETARVRKAREGQRHHLLLTRTIVIGRFVVWGEIARDVVEAAFGAAGEAAGLPAAECRATIRDALAYSARTCRARETT